MGGTDGEFLRVDLLVAHENPPGGGRHDPGQRLDQRGFAGAIVAHQPDDLVAADRQVDVAQRMYGAKVFLDAFHAHDVPKIFRHGAVFSLRRFIRQ